MDEELHLYFDDTGSRFPDREPAELRQDGMDCFGLGGILVKKEDVDLIYSQYKAFCAQWEIGYPLHSSSIRGGRGKFGWLKKPELAGEFLPSLSVFLEALPVLGIAAIIHRPGYNERYHTRYHGKPWLMCKTACCILVERAAKQAMVENRYLRIFFEQSGKAEDQDIKQYVRTLKKEGMPFNVETSAIYQNLTADQLKSTIRGEPRERSKNVPMIQIADLYLYPMAKAGYDPAYRAYRRLMQAGKIIDAVLSDDERLLRGVKYSCFDNGQKKGPDNRA